MLLQYWLWCEDGTVYLKHLLLQNKELSPQVQHVGLEGTAHGTKIKLAGNSWNKFVLLSKQEKNCLFFTSINCEGLVKEKSPLQEIFHFCPVKSSC
jgi:hypothetical protein